MQFIMPVYVLSSIVLGGTEVSGSEEQDPACDLALIFGLFFHTDLMGPQGPADRPLLSLSVTCGCPLP